MDIFHWEMKQPTASGAANRGTLVDSTRGNPDVRATGNDARRRAGKSSQKCLLPLGTTPKGRATSVRFKVKVKVFIKTYKNVYAQDTGRL